MESKLKKSIDKLREELAELDDGDASVRERVEALVDRIDRKLAADADLEDEGLMDHIQEDIAEFETSHPRITAIIDSIANTLSNMGI